MHDQTLLIDQATDDDARGQLIAELKACPPHEAAALLVATAPRLAIEALAELNPSFIQDILAAVPDEFRQAVMSCASSELARQWEHNQSYETGAISRFMEPTYAMFSPEMTVNESIAKLRTLVKTVFITYGYVTDPDGKLLGLVTMRDLLFAEGAARLSRRLHFPAPVAT